MGTATSPQVTRVNLLYFKAGVSRTEIQWPKYEWTSEFGLVETKVKYIVAMGMYVGKCYSEAEEMRIHEMFGVQIDSRKI